MKMGYGSRHSPVPRCRRRAVTAKRMPSIHGVVRIEILVHVAAIHDRRRDDQNRINLLALEHGNRHIHGLTHHQRAVQRGADVDGFVFLDDLEVLLASAAAGDDLNIGATRVFNRLKHADGGFVIQAVNGVDLLVRREDIGEILQAVFTGERGRVFNHVHFRRDLLDRVGEALHAQLGNAAAGRNRKRHDGAGGADLIDDVLGGLNTHALVVAGHAVHAVRVDDDIEVHDGNAGINRVLNRYFHAFPLRERDDRLRAPGHEVVQLRGKIAG